MHSVPSDVKAVRGWIEEMCPTPNVRTRDVKPQEPGAVGGGVSGAGAAGCAGGGDAAVALPDPFAGLGMPQRA